MLVLFNLAAGQILKIDRITWSDTIRFIWLLFLFVCFDWEFHSMGWISFIFHLNPLYCRSTMCYSNLLFSVIVFVFFVCNVHVLKINCNSETSKLTKFNRNCKRMQRKRTDKNSTAFTFFCNGPNISIHKQLGRDKQEGISLWKFSWLHIFAWHLSILIYKYIWVLITCTYGDDNDDQISMECMTRLLASFCLFIQLN